MNLKKEKKVYVNFCGLTLKFSLGEFPTVDMLTASCFMVSPAACWLSHSSKYPLLQDDFS